VRTGGPEPLEPRSLLSAGHGLGHPAHGPRHAAPAHGLSGVVYSRDGSTLDVIRPPGATPPGGWPVIVAIPGGGWRWVDKSSYETAVAAAFVPHGYEVVAIDYAYNSPGGPPTWPANIEDVRQAIRWVRSNADRLGADPGRIVAMGESAGAHLAELAGVLPDGPVPVEGADLSASRPTPDGVSARVEAVVAFYGPTDLIREYQDQPEGRSYLVSYLGGTPDQVPGRYVAASPVSHVTPDDPPMALFQGTNDRIVAPDQPTELAQALRAAGVPAQLHLLEGRTHGFRFRGRRVDLLPGILAFLDAALNPPAPAAS
jgi:acetyl esterase/lipase